MSKAISRAVFLDRDGTINEEVDHLHDVRDLRILPGVAEAVQILNKRGYRVIVITNQSVVAKGIATTRTVADIHGAIKTHLAKSGAMIDAFYFCPHHPEGSVEEYAIACDCRKPKTGMITRAADDFNIDLAKSFLVGDTTGDILTGNRAGVKTVLVKTGYAGRDGLHDAIPDFVADDLMAATEYIL